MITGIISEYNPFHNGHLYQINQIQKLHNSHNDASNAIVACISGGCTQRGTIHLLDKWTRGSIAVQNGVNLVIELPAAYCVASAQNFAAGGIKLLDSLGIVDSVAFGTEYNRYDLLNSAASINPDSYSEEISSLMNTGLSYGAAISRIIAAKLQISEDTLREPNTILAIEYMRAINRTASSIHPIPLQRIGTGHHDSTSKGKYASGTAIRNMLSKGDIDTIQQVVPPETLTQLIKTQQHNIQNNLLPVLRWILATHSAAELSTFSGVAEGIEYKLKEAACCNSIAEIINLLGNRHYTITRIQRMLSAIMLRLDMESHQRLIDYGPKYIRVLAFDDIGRKLLKEIKSKSQLPLITKTADFLNYRDCARLQDLTPLQEQLALDIQAQNLFSQAHNTPLNCDFTTSPYFKK